MSQNFICYDGETINNKYVLLGNHKDHIYNKKGLTSRQCLKYLTQLQRKKRIVFNIDYDIQFWVKDFPNEKILDLLNSKEVKYYNYTLLYFKNKMLIIRKGKSKFRYYDIISFFNKSLLNTIDLLKIELTKEEKYILELGKEKREFNFKGMNLKQIILYNKTECIITNKIAGRIENLLTNSKFYDIKGKEQNLNIKNFYGSSAISSKILKYYKIGTLKYFPKFQSIFESAYYGGRFECLKLGSFKNIYKYDINSAYPSIMRDLKEVKNFTKRRFKKNEKILDEGIYFIYFKLFYPKNFICPFPLRHKTGRIFYTGEIKGYYFGCEINSFLKSGINKENYILDIKESVIPEFTDKYIFENKKGVNVITSLYILRKVFKKQNDLRSYIYKIALNAMYGKLAQTVGSASYQNLYYAGYITAKTRSLLLDASFTTDYNNIIAYATDSILSKKPLNINCSFDLGEWEKEKIKNAEVLLSGFYRLENNEGKFIYGIRGFKSSRNNFDKILKDIYKKGFSEIYFNQFIGHKLYFHNYKFYKNRRLHFVRNKKIINPITGNFKREYNLNGKFKTCNSSFVTLDSIESVNKFTDKTLLNTYLIYVDY